MNYNIYAICGNELYVFNSKEEAKDFFSECYYSSEGSERSRYASILVGLNYNNICKDDISTECRGVNIKENGSEDIIYSSLPYKMPIKDTIDYFQTKVLPILKVANDYSVDFHRKIPFEHFGADEDSSFMASFTDFYNEILNGNLRNAETIEKSDGKYEMMINDNSVIDLRAWDDLENVIDNVETIKKELNLDNKLLPRNLITRKCYFFNVGVTFDINDFEKAYDVWGCNGNACKSDVINGLSCENYGVNFNEEATRNYIKEYVKKGCDNTYGYMVERNIELPKEDWKEIDEELVKSYGYDNLEDAKQNGFIPFDFAQLEDCCSYYEQPNESYLKQNNIILKNKINVYDEKTALDKNYAAVSRILNDIYKDNNIGINKMYGAFINGHTHYFKTIEEAHDFIEKQKIIDNMDSMDLS